MREKLTKGAEGRVTPLRPGDVVATELASLRERYGLTQNEVAARLGALGVPTDRVTVANIERGARKVSLADAVHLAAALRVPLLRLLVSERPIELTPTVSTDSATVLRWASGLQPLFGGSDEDRDIYFEQAPGGDAWGRGLLYLLSQANDLASALRERDAAGAHLAIRAMRDELDRQDAEVRRIKREERKRGDDS